jgi:hypothetical protein
MIKPLMPAKPREPEEFWPRDKKLYSGLGPIRAGDFPAEAQIDAYIENNEHDSSDCWAVLEITLPEKTRNEKYEEEKSLYDAEMVVYEKKMVIYREEMKAWTEHCKVQARLDQIKALETQKALHKDEMVRVERLLRELELK